MGGSGAPLAGRPKSTRTTMRTSTTGGVVGHIARSARDKGRKGEIVHERVHHELQQPAHVEGPSFGPVWRDATTGDFYKLNFQLLGLRAFKHPPPPCRQTVN